MPRTQEAASPPRSNHNQSNSSTAEASKLGFKNNHSTPSSSSPSRHIPTATPSASSLSGFADDRLFPAGGSPRLYKPEASTSAHPWIHDASEGLLPPLLHPSPSDRDDSRSQDLPAFATSTMPLFSSLAAMLSSASEITPQPPPASPDRCFCGEPADEDSIYCSSACGRKDAMQALCAEGDSKSHASGSHYRRVELEENKREKERQRAKAREKRDRQTASARMGTWRFGAGAATDSRSPPSPSPTPSYQSSTSSRRRSRDPSERSDSVNSHVPSLSSDSSSSVVSYADSESSLSSPTSASFIPSTPPQHSHKHFPPSPHSTLCGEIDIYDSYLGTATPIARAQPSPDPSSPFKTFTLGGRSPQFGSEEERDFVEHGIGFGGQQLKARIQSRTPRTHGHQKAKLSFDDVVGIMGNAALM
ncbi:hypothetical protein RQP46_007108 [Phenoliferia psychrophenolica]